MHTLLFMQATAGPITVPSVSLDIDIDLLNCKKQPAVFQKIRSWAHVCPYR